MGLHWQHFIDDRPCHAIHSNRNQLIIGENHENLVGSKWIMAADNTVVIQFRYSPVPSFICRLQDLVIEALDLCAGMTQQNLRNHFSLACTGEARLSENARG